ncbi:MAG: transketolase C-terminal domain-containing protein [Clostridiales bacterium]|nr:transketolase C-terminal domain-containing protein [Clostridiales bacterium]
MCGIGAEIVFIINGMAFKYLDAPVKRVTSRQGPVPYSRKLEQLTVPSEECIMEAVREVLYVK